MHYALRTSKKIHTLFVAPLGTFRLPSRTAFPGDRRADISMSTNPANGDSDLPIRHVAKESSPRLTIRSFLATILVLLAIPLAVPGVLLTFGGVGNALSIALRYHWSRLLDFGLFREALLAIFVGPWLVAASVGMLLLSRRIGKINWRIVGMLAISIVVTALLGVLYSMLKFG